MVGEVVLGVMLVATLTFSPRDAAPSAGYDDAWAAQVVTPYQSASGEQPQFGFTLPGLQGLTKVARAGGMAISSKALIPSSPPAQLLIPSLNVHRPVEPVGVDRSGTMAVPVNLWNAGWYKEGPVPGAPGDAVIEGHAGYPAAPLLFGRLRQLRSGDKIVVVLADGTRRLFLVDSVTNWPALSTPTGLFDSVGPPRLSLITCSGLFDDRYKTYADRLIVEASYAGVV